MEVHLIYRQSRNIVSPICPKLDCEKWCTLSGNDQCSSKFCASTKYFARWDPEPRSLSWFILFYFAALEFYSSSDSSSWRKGRLEKAQGSSTSSKIFTNMHLFHSTWELSIRERNINTRKNSLETIKSKLSRRKKNETLSLTVDFYPELWEGGGSERIWEIGTKKSPVACTQFIGISRSTSNTSIRQQERPHRLLCTWASPSNCWLVFKLFHSAKWAARSYIFIFTS